MIQEWHPTEELMKVFHKVKSHENQYKVLLHDRN